MSETSPSSSSPNFDQIGRNSHYDLFTLNTQPSTLNTPLPSWQQTAGRIYQFIEDTTANSTYHAWDKQTPSFIVKKDEQQSPAQQYIYWNKEN